MSPKDPSTGWPGSFRCDGLVEWSYDQVGLGFFTDEEVKDCMVEIVPIPTPPYFIVTNLPTFYSKALLGRMTPEVPKPPVVNFVNPQDGDNVKDEVEVEVTINDLPMGSGVDRVQLFIDNRPVDEPDDEDEDAEKQFNYTWDTEDIRCGMHLLRIEAYDRAGNLTEKEIEVYKGEAPYVILTIPSDGATDISIDKDRSDIFIMFSEAMDRTSTEGAISISPDLPHNLVWNPGDEAITMYFNEDLNYCEEYTITVTDAAMDTAGVHLDGNKDGRAGGNYPFTFSTEPPDMWLYLNPFVANVEEGDPLRVSLYGDGRNVKKEIDCNMDFKVYNPVGWSVLTPHTAIGLRLTAKV